MGLQKSRYIQIENDFIMMTKFAKIIEKDLQIKND